MSGIKICKLKGESFIQVLVAMIIITTVFAVSVFIYLNILSSTYNYKKANLALLFNDVIIETKKKKTFFDEEFEVENIIVRKSISKYNGDIYLIYLKAFEKDGKQIYERRELFLIDQYAKN